MPHFSHLFRFFGKTSLFLWMFCLAIPTTNADVRIGPDGDILICSEIAGEEICVSKDECGIDFGGDLGGLIGGIGGKVGGAIGDLIGDVDIGIGDCNNGAGIPNGRFEVESQRERFLQTELVDGKVYPLCKVTDENSILPSPTSVSDQTSGQYELAYNPFFNTEEEKFVSQCQVDYGVATTRSIRSFIVQLINWALTFLGLVALMAIIYAGYLYIFYYGDDNRTTQAKDIILYAIVGIIIILLAWAIVNTVIRALVGFDADLDPDAVTSTSISSSTSGLGAGDTAKVSLQVTSQDGSPVYNYGGGYWIPLESAAKGVEFTLPAGETVQFTSLNWYFGNGTQKTYPELGQEVPFSAQNESQKFGKEGVYSITSNGRTVDQISVSGGTRLAVGMVEAGFSWRPNTPIASQESTFSAKKSSTKVGEIVQYHWQCTALSPNATCPSELNSSTAEEEQENVIFDAGGEYEITLGVETTFSEGQVLDFDTQKIEVLSGKLTAAQALPIVSTKNSSAPAEYILDASPSLNLKGRRFGLTYLWDIYNASGTKIDTIRTSSTRTIYNFAKKGTYYVVLTTQDTLDGEIITSENSLEANPPSCPPPACGKVEIDSILELDFTTNSSYSTNVPYNFVGRVLSGPPLDQLTDVNWSLDTSAVIAMKIPVKGSLKTQLIKNNPVKPVLEKEESKTGEQDERIISKPPLSSSENQKEFLPEKEKQEPITDDSENGYPAPETDNSKAELLSTTGNSTTITFYKQGGPYYITFSAKTADGDQSSITKAVYVREGGEPLAIITPNVDQEDILLPPNALVLTRDQDLSLASNQSLNADGTSVSETKSEITWVVDGQPIAFGEGADGGINQVIDPRPGDAIGTKTVKLIVTDRQNKALRDESILNVRIENKMPQFGTPPTQINVNEAKADITMNVSDPDSITANFPSGRMESYKFEVLEFGTVIESQITKENTATFDFSAYPGTHNYDLRVTATDADGGISTYTKYNAFEMVIDEPENEPPTLEIYAQNSFGDTDSPFFFFSVTADPENDFVELEWDFDCNNAYPGNEPTTSKPNPNWRYERNEGVSYPVEVTICATATDGIEAEGRPVEKQLTIIVNEGDGRGPDGSPLENFPPEVNITGVTPAETKVAAKKYQAPIGTRFAFTANVTDLNQSDTHDLIWELSGSGADQKTQPTVNPSFIHIFESAGTYNVSLKATENNTDETFEGEDSVEITIVEEEETENQPPTVVIQAVDPGLTAEVGSRITVFPYAIDPESGQNVTYNWQLNGEAQQTSPASNSLVFLAEEEGTYTAQVTVTDPENAESEPASVEIQIGEGLIPPETEPNVVITNVSPEKGTTAQTFQFFAQATDLDGDKLTYQWQVQGQEPQKTPYSAFSAIFPEAGTYTVTVTVTDEDENTASDQKTVTVVETEVGSPADNTPIVNITAISPTDVFNTEEIHGRGDQNTIFQIYATAIDPDTNDKIQYVWQMGDGTTYTTPLEAINHQYSEAGTYTVQVTATDLANQSNSDSAQITVTPNGEEVFEPAVKITSITPDDPKTTADLIQFYSVSTIPEGERWTYEWQMGDGTTYFRPSVSHVYENAGSYSVNLTATDGIINFTDSATVSILDAQNPENPIPNVFILGANQGAQFADGERIALSASTQFLDPNTTQYLWSMGDGTTYTTPNITHFYENAGSYTISLRVQDATGNVAEQFLDITALNAGEIVNNPPIAQITVAEPKTAKIGELFQFQGTGLTNEVENLTFEWDMGDGISYAKQAVNHIYSEVGTYVVRFRVSDGLQTIEDTVNITVLANPDLPNRPPEANINLVSANTVPIGGLVAFQSNTKDPDGDTTTINWDFGDGGTSALPAPTHVFNTNGTYTVTLTVSDGQETTTDSTQIQVVPANQMPDPNQTIEITKVIPSRQIKTGERVELYSRISGFMPDSLQYQWDMGDGTQFNRPSVAYVYQNAGVYNINFTVSDGIATQTITEQITVIENGQLPENPSPNPELDPNAPLTGIISGVWPGTRITTRQNVAFYSSATDADGDPLTYTWEFPDGVRYNVANVWHRFQNVGDYTVKLTVTDGEHEVSDEINITVIESTELPEGFVPLPGISPEEPIVIDPNTGEIYVPLPLPDDRLVTTMPIDEEVRVGTGQNIDKIKDPLQDERERLMLELGFTTDPTRRQEIRQRVDEIDRIFIQKQENLAKNPENTALINGIYTKYLADLKAEQAFLTKKLEETTDPAVAKILAERLIQTEKAILAVEQNPSLALVALGISLTDGVVPYVTIKGTKDTKFFLYGTAPTESETPLQFAWDFGNGTTANGQNAIIKYEEEGYFRVRYTIFDGERTAEDIVIIKVEPARKGLLRK